MNSETIERSIQMIELQQLVYFIAIAKCGTLSGAAEELNISQPSLSRSMKILENELGILLFDRTKNKIVLNEAGKLALSYAKHVIDDVNTMEHAMQAYERSLHTITIASVAPGPLWSLMPSMMKRFPKMNISTEINPKEDLKEKLTDNTYQLIVTIHPFDDDIISIPYLEEQLFLTVPHGHPLCKHKEGICMSELADETILLYTEIGYWEERVIRKLTQTNFIRQTERSAFQELVRMSGLPSFATNLSIKDDIMHADSTNRICIPLLDDDTKIQFYCSTTIKNQEYLDALL